MIELEEDESMRSRAEIEKQIDAAGDPCYPTMTYEEGVRAALEWVLGETDELPMEEWS